MRPCGSAAAARDGVACAGASTAMMPQAPPNKPQKDRRARFAPPARRAGAGVRLWQLITCNARPHTGVLQLRWTAWHAGVPPPRRRKHRQAPKKPGSFSRQARRTSRGKLRQLVTCEGRTHAALLQPRLMVLHAWAPLVRCRKRADESRSWAHFAPARPRARSEAQHAHALCLVRSVRLRGGRTRAALPIGCQHAAFRLLTRRAAAWGGVVLGRV